LWHDSSGGAATRLLLRASTFLWRHHETILRSH
jgi:hypothetical protein